MEELNLDDLFQTADLDVSKVIQPVDLLSSLFMTADITNEINISTKGQKELIVSSDLTTQLQTPQQTKPQPAILKLQQQKSLLSPILSDIIDNLYAETFIFPKENQTSYIKQLLQQLQNNNLPFPLPPTKSLLNQVLPIVPFPSILYNFHTEKCTKKVAKIPFTLDNANFLQLKLLHSNIFQNEQLQFYVEKLLNFITFEKLSSIVLVNIKSKNFTPNQLFSLDNDNSSPFYQVIQIPIVTSLENPFFTPKTLYILAKQNNFRDDFSTFLVQIQLFISRFLLLDKSVIDKMFVFTPEILLSHMQKLQKNTQDSLLRRVYEENHPIHSLTVNVFILAQNYLSDGQFFAPYNSKITFKLGQKIIISGCEKRGFLKQTEAIYENMLDRSNLIIINENNVRDGTGFDLGVFKNLTFQCKSENLVTDQQFPHIIITILDLFEDADLVLGKFEIFNFYIEKQKITECGVYSCFIGRLNSSQLMGINGEVIWQLSCQSYVQMKNLKQSKVDYLLQYDVQIKESINDEAIGDADGVQILLKGQELKNAYKYRVQGLSMGLREGKQLIRVLIAKVIK